MRIRVAPNFYLDEFVNIYTYFSEPDNGLSQVNPKMFEIAQFTHDYFGKSVIINNWWKWYQVNGSNYPDKPAGIYDMRGMRPHSLPYEMIYGVKVIGAKHSMHRCEGDRKCGAIDLNVSGLTTREVYEAIRAERKFYEIGVRRMENIAVATSWNHLDIMETGKDKIYIFNP